MAGVGFKAHDGSESVVMPKHTAPFGSGYARLGFRISFGFRASDFGFGGLLPGGTDRMHPHAGMQKNAEA
jgi:hypothetical protein